jgi:MFS family permease
MLLSLIPFAGLVAPVAASWVGRFGLRRTFVVFWAARKVAFTLILFVPAILHTLGAEFAFWWVAVIVLLFSLCRAIAETGFYPWLQEIIPNKIRGQVWAILTTVSTLGSLAALAVAGNIIDRMQGIERFMLLFAAGLVFGILGVVSYAMLPGGASLEEETALSSRSTEMRHALHDRNYIQFMLTLALISIGGSIGGSFVALYANEQVGLSTGNVVLLSIGSSFGALIATYPMGWAADRYGSRTMMVIGLALSVLMPLGWIIMPRHDEASLPVAMAFSFIGAVVGAAWGTGSTRYLFSNAVPPEQKTGYLAVWYAWSAIIGGSGPLLAGWFLHLFEGVSGYVLGFPIDAYTPLFIFNALTILIGLVLISRVRDDEAVPVRTLLRHAMSFRLGRAGR